jgi:hypothetical protein
VPYHRRSSCCRRTFRSTGQHLAARIADPETFQTQFKHFVAMRSTYDCASGHARVHEFLLHYAIWSSQALVFFANIRRGRPFRTNLQINKLRYYFMYK